MSLRHSEDVHEIVLREDRVDRNLLLEEALGKIDLGLGVGSSVDLDLHDVSLFDTKVELLGLRMGDDPDDLAELGNAIELGLDILSIVLGVLLRVLGVSLPLGLVPASIHDKYYRKRDCKRA